MKPEFRVLGRTVPRMGGQRNCARQQHMASRPSESRPECNVRSSRSVCPIDFARRSPGTSRSWIGRALTLLSSTSHPLAGLLFPSLRVCFPFLPSFALIRAVGVVSGKTRNGLGEESEQGDQAHLERDMKHSRRSSTGHAIATDPHGCSRPTWLFHRS
jgi:hypothetical protein